MKDNKAISVIVDRIATMKRDNNGQAYHYRKDSDIRNVVNYTINGNEKSGKPIYSNSRSFISDIADVEGLTQEIMENQALFNKCKGIRIRHEFVEVDKSELDPKEQLQQIKKIADRFTDYYFYQGYRTTYGVFDLKDKFRINYAIDPVNYHNGTKYRYNRKEVMERENIFLINTVDSVISNSESRNDLQELEYYPW